MPQSMYDNDIFPRYGEIFKKEKQLKWFLWRLLAPQDFKADGAGEPTRTYPLTFEIQVPSEPWYQLQTYNET